MFKKLLKIFGILLGVVLVVLVGAVGAVYGISSYRMGQPMTITPGPIAVPTDPPAVARGQHWATAITKCIDCHGPNFGGMVVIDDPMFGKIVSRNLTTGKGGLGGQLTDVDFDRAIRHGVGHDGHKLIFMPSDVFTYLDDKDVASIIAYVRSMKPVDSDQPQMSVGPIARVLYLSHKIPMLVTAEDIDHAAHPSAPPAGVTVEYGKYLATVGGCVSCHGPGLSGGHVPGTPPDPQKFPDAQNLTPTGIGTWKEADFFKALRQGVRPDGSPINVFMPWPQAGKMTDDEIKAVWMFLKTVPAKETGNR